MPDDVLDAAAEMWNLAWARADETAAAERRGHAVEVDKVRADLADQEEAVEIVEDERDQALKRAEAAEAKLDEATVKLRTAEIEIAELRGRLAERADQDANHRRAFSRS